MILPAFFSPALPVSSLTTPAQLRAIPAPLLAEMTAQHARLPEVVTDPAQPLALALEADCISLVSCPLLDRLLDRFLVKLIRSLSGPTNCEFHLRAHEVSPNDF
jgi:hypothetical protein